MLKCPPPPPSFNTNLTNTPVFVVVCVCNCFLHKPSWANCTIKSLLHIAVVVGTTWPWSDSAVAMWMAGCLTHASHTITCRLTREPSINLQSKIGTQPSITSAVDTVWRTRACFIHSTIPPPTPQLLILPPPPPTFPCLPPSSWHPPPPPISLFPTPSSHSVYIFAANLCY